MKTDFLHRAKGRHFLVHPLDFPGDLRTILCVGGVDDNA